MSYLNEIHQLVLVVAQRQLILIIQEVSVDGHVMLIIIKCEIHVNLVHHDILELHELHHYLDVQSHV